MELEIIKEYTYDRCIAPLKLTTDRHEASRSLFATAELLVSYYYNPWATYKAEHRTTPIRILSRVSTAMLSRDNDIGIMYVCPSVCPSVCHAPVQCDV